MIGLLELLCKLCLVRITDSKSKEITQKPYSATFRLLLVILVNNMFVTHLEAQKRAGDTRAS